MELTYRKCGDYYIPNLTLGDTKEYNIGKYGWLRRTYLKKQRPAMYNLLLATDRLLPHLEEVETACQEQLEIMEKAMMAERVSRKHSRPLTKWNGYGGATPFAAVRKKSFR